MDNFTQLCVLLIICLSLAGFSPYTCVLCEFLFTVYHFVKPLFHYLPFSVYFFFNKIHKRGKEQCVSEIIHQYPLFTLCVICFLVCNSCVCKLSGCLPTLFHTLYHTFVDFEKFFPNHTFVVATMPFLNAF